MLRIGIAFSLKPADQGGASVGPDDLYEEFDKPETIEAIAEAIRADGHDVSLLGDGHEFLKKLLTDPSDFVFNFAEGCGVSRSREARIPAVCEMLGVPYSGSDPLTMAVALDKDVAKILVAASHGMRVPLGCALSPKLTRSEVIHQIQDGLFRKAEDLVPLILKPTFEGSSKGVRGRCLADTAEEAADRFAELASDYGQPILIEQFIDGEEVTVGVIGNGQDTRVIGAMQIRPKIQTQRFVYSLEVKRDWINQVDYESPASLPEKTQKGLFLTAKMAYDALGCRDVARIDYRIDDKGDAYFLEANPLPGLAPVTSDLVILAEGYGISHGDLVRKILHAALNRVGLA